MNHLVDHDISEGLFVKVKIVGEEYALVLVFLALLLVILTLDRESTF